MPSKPSAATLEAAWEIIRYYPELGWSKAALADYHIFLNAHAVAIFSQVLDEAELLLIATHPEHLHQGHAEALLKKTFQQLTVKTIFLEVRESNQAARQLYKKLGFLKAGLRKAYYRNPIENALILKK